MYVNVCVLCVDVACAGSEPIPIFAHAHQNTHPPTTKRRANNANALTSDVVHSQRMARALAALERMVGQNAQDEIFHDCRFWEDPSDGVKVKKGFWGVGVCVSLRFWCFVVIGVSIHHFPKTLSRPSLTAIN